jgi:hypothetical protein
LLSEIHPTARIDGYDLATQAKNWFNYEVTLDGGFVPAVKRLLELTVADDRLLVLRSWSHADYVPCRSNDYHPPCEDALLEILKPHFNLRVLTLVRNPEDTWRSMTKFPGFANDISQGLLTRPDFDLCYGEFLEQSRPPGILHYEDLCSSPDFALHFSCSLLNLPFDLNYASKWPDYHKVTGDLSNTQRTIERSPSPRRLSYENVPGYCNFENLYKKAVEEAPTDRPSTFVEVGVFFGRSLLYLAERVRESGKPIRIHAVDPFCQGWTRQALRDLFDDVVRKTSTCAEISCKEPILYPEWYREGHPDDVLPGVLSGIVEAAHQLGILDLIDFRPTRGQNVALFYPNESIDFCFLDASHTYEETLELLHLYLPKIRPGGILAGHDFGEPAYPGIERAVKDMFGRDFEVLGTSFVHRKVGA